ncbi:MAG TPA: 2Fe-2S iron-sulfur cluster-binding protein [Bacteroidota bacterium]|nr:2Fe-2S iron-sulfur cluster-binding protein [Bacteroidota bacterium]
MTSISITINGANRQVEIDPGTPLLWVLRDELGMTGTKFGCGRGLCGYCQSGQIMTAAELLTRKKDPTDEEIDAAMSQNLCRCGTYQRIRRAVHRAAQETK